MPDHRPDLDSVRCLPPSIAPLSQRIGLEREPAQALNHLVESVRQELGIDRAGIFAYDRHGNRLERVAGVDRNGRPEFGGNAIEVRGGDSPLMQVACRERPFYFSQDAPSEFPHYRFPEGVRSLAIVPVIAGGELVGMLCADNCLSNRPLSEKILEPLFVYAGLAAIPLFARYVRREQEREEACRRAMCGEMLYAVSGGKISLCSRDQIHSEWPSLEQVIPIQEPTDIRVVRGEVNRITAQAGMDEDRAGDFALCVSEAATNALIHGSGGTAVAEARNGVVRARIEDRGAGISIDQLPSATLVKGWSSKCSMGLGFTVMVETTDRIFLNTSAAGTILILEMGIAVPETDLSLDALLQWGEGIEL